METTWSLIGRVTLSSSGPPWLLREADHLEPRADEEGLQVVTIKAAVKAETQNALLADGAVVEAVAAVEDAVVAQIVTLRTLLAKIAKTRADPDGQPTYYGLHEGKF